MRQYSYIITVLFVAISLLYSLSCSLDLDLDWGYNFPPIPPVPLDQIAGDYEGNIKYWVNDQEYLLDLSKDNGYLTTITRHDKFFTIAFDTLFIYKVPNLDFTLTNSPYPNSIQLDSGQLYTNWDPINRSTYAGEFNINFSSIDTTISFGLNIQDLLPDSTYYLTFYGRRKL